MISDNQPWKVCEEQSVNTEVETQKKAKQRSICNWNTN